MLKLQMELKHASRELPSITSPEGREEEEYGMEKMAY